MNDLEIIEIGDCLGCYMIEGKEEVLGFWAVYFPSKKYIIPLN
jgi:hypothetical protein